MICFAAGFAAGQSSARETRNLKGFSRINYGISGNLEVKLGNEYSVVLEGEKSDLNRIISEVSGDRLTLKHDNMRFGNFGKVNVYVTMPSVTGLSVSGSGKAVILDPVRTEDLDLNVSGSGRLVTSDLAVENIDCGISGSGNITIAGGTVKNVDLTISGSGNFSGEEATISMLDVSVSGSGSCTCFVAESIDASISGSGSVYYKGDPSVRARVSGSGRVRPAR